MESPEIALEREESVSIAFLTLLEALSTEERAAFVLHDILDDDYVDIAESLGKSQVACRQLIHRAREAHGSKAPLLGGRRDAYAHARTIHRRRESWRS